MPNSKPPNASFILICFHLQLAFHDLYDVFCFAKIELQNSKTKAAISIFVSKSCSTCIDTPIIDHKLK